MLPIQMQILGWWLESRARLDDAARRLRDDRGELTGNVIFLAALAVAAAAVAGIIIARLNAAASRVP